MFQPLAQFTLAQLVQALRSHDTRFEGIAHSYKDVVSPKYFMGEHGSLGSDAAMLPRIFHRGASDLQGFQAEMDFPGELVKHHAISSGSRTTDKPRIEHNRIETANSIQDAVVTLIRNKRTR